MFVGLIFSKVLLRYVSLLFCSMLGQITQQFSKFESLYYNVLTRNKYVVLTFLEIDMILKEIWKEWSYQKTSESICYSRVFLLCQSWIVNYFVKSQSYNLSNENINTGVSVVFKTKRELKYQNELILKYHFSGNTTVCFHY